MNTRENLNKELLKLGARRDVQAKSFTSFRIGGPAAYFAEPRNLDELAAFLNAAKEFDFPVLVIGNGSNLLVSDNGIDALVIRIGSRMSDYSIEGTQLVSAAGALLCTVAKASVAAGLAGLEWAAGIPGTVGGGVAMNAGAYNGEIKNVIKSVTFIENGEIVKKTVRDSDLGYRYSAFAWPERIAVGAEFELHPDDGCAEARMAHYNAMRKQKQPIEMPSAGSTFKRPAGNFAGALIEQAGLKGKRIGNAMVSPKHAGFIVNCGGATFEDVMSLIDFVRDEVYSSSGILLEPEVKIIK